MLDKYGYRLNVGIILVNDKKELFWGKRKGRADIWQFPQGGVQPYETLEETMYRELNEEIGLKEKDVSILKMSERWLKYDLPYGIKRFHQGRVCWGQKQRWFLLSFLGDETSFCFDTCSEPEFDGWRWVDYWYPADNIINFKRRVYTEALKEFSPIIFGN